MAQERQYDGVGDWELLSEIAQGEKNAFQEIHRRYGNVVYGFVNRLVAHRETAEDLSQEVFLRLLRRQGNRPFEQGNAKFSTLLLGIAKNVVLEHWQTVKVERKAMEQLKAEQKVEPAIEHTETRDMFHQIALEEMSNPRNWRKGKPLPNLAFHLAVYRRREAGIEEQLLRSDMGRESSVVSGPSVLRRYLWLRLWSGTEEASVDSASV
ncbi:MAG: hypothetical protein GX455_02100 [Phycisphaerae bacterium]|nr:hypothetical protein [Phycisphaerae bacterium]